MISLLRRIRRSLIESGSTRKYLLYAIGEIFLVMIGILLALQVNNWNEWRKDRAKEKEILQEISINLETKKRQIEENIKSSKYSISAKQQIKSYFEVKPVSNDSIDKYLGWCQIATFNSILVSTGYEMMKSEGLEIIGSTQLRKSIIDLYELEFPNLKQREENRYASEQEEISRYLRLNAVSSNNSTKLKDYESFLKNQFFLENLKPLLAQDQIVNYNRQETKNAIIYVQQLIQDEMEDGNLNI